MLQCNKSQLQTRVKGQGVEVVDFFRLAALGIRGPRWARVPLVHTPVLFTSSHTHLGPHAMPPL
eukprot:scaffold189751_cov21-Tisochrysis_lutea.AAC.1